MKVSDVASRPWVWVSDRYAIGRVEEVQVMDSDPHEKGILVIRGGNPRRVPLIHVFDSSREAVTHARICRGYDGLHGAVVVADRRGNVLA